MRIGELSTMMVNMGRLLSDANRGAARASQRLATGKRVNSAADDPAGIFMIARATAELRGTQAAQRNIADTISLVETIDGAYSTINSAVEALSELAVRYHNPILTAEDKAAIEQEAQSLLDTIDNAFSNITFNGVPVFSRSSYTVATGQGPNMEIPVPGLRVTAGTTPGTYRFTGGDTPATDTPIADILDSAFIQANLVAPLASAEAAIGAVENRLNAQLDYHRTMESAVASRLSFAQDADMALEAMNLARNQILEQSSIAMISAYSSTAKSQTGSLLNIQY